MKSALFLLVVCGLAFIATARRTTPRDSDENSWDGSLGSSEEDPWANPRRAQPQRPTNNNGDDWSSNDANCKEDDSDEYLEDKPKSPPRLQLFF